MSYSTPEPTPTAMTTRSARLALRVVGITMQGGCSLRLKKVMPCLYYGGQIDRYNLRSDTLARTMFVDSEILRVADRCDKLDTVANWTM